jgi:hypothetical protein
MAELEFSRNYSDLSVSSGVNAGFQFEFSCEGCGDTWRSAFVPYRSGQASGWIGKAAGLFGGVLGGVGSAVEGMADSGFGEARDEAFRKAIAQAKGHFHRCAKCSAYVCAKCWNKAKGLCRGCAPDVAAEIEAARAQGEVYGAAEEAVNEGLRRGKKADVKRERQLVCPECGAATHGAKFCPECGHKLAVADSCSQCHAKIPPGAKFCPECGHKTGS